MQHWLRQHNLRSIGCVSSTASLLHGLLLDAPQRLVVFALCPIAAEVWWTPGQVSARPTSLAHVQGNKESSFDLGERMGKPAGRVSHSFDMDGASRLHHSSGVTANVTVAEEVRRVSLQQESGGGSPMVGRAAPAVLSHSECPHAGQSVQSTSAVPPFPALNTPPGVPFCPGTRFQP